MIKQKEKVSVNLKEDRDTTDVLKAQLSVLLIKGEISYRTSIDEIQQYLQRRFDVEYCPSDVEEVLFVLKVEEEEQHMGNDVVEQEEDFFEGY